MTPLRSTATLRHYGLEDEEDLFGGNRKKTSNRSLASSSIDQKSPVLVQKEISSPPSLQTYLPKHPTPPSTLPVEQVKPSLPKTPTPPSTSPAQARPTAIDTIEEKTVNKIPEKKTPEEKTSEEKTPEKKTPEEKTPERSSSFFRFFKTSSSSKTNNSSKTTSSASSVHSIPAKEPEDMIPQQHTIRTVPPIQPKVVPSQPIQEEKEEMIVIEDEATRAFADDITFQSKSPYLDIMTPELTMDALRLDQPIIPNTSPSSAISTPTHTSLDDPWFDQSSQVSDPSHLAIQVQDIEPQKRTAFADLINSWNTNQTNDVPRIEPEEDPEQFFEHVAEERRDIGFAGIGATPRPTVEWVAEEQENPWH